MYLRLSLDPRVLLPVLMLGGLATSLALSARPHRAESHPSETAHAPLWSAKSAKTLPTALDPGASLAPAPSPRPSNSLLVLPDPSVEDHARAVANPSPATPPADLAPEACAEGMVLVEGDYCPVL